MKNTSLNEIIRKSAAASLLAAVCATSSMLALASTSNKQLVGELVVASANLDKSTITIDGEPALTGRSVFTSSTIKTPADKSAIVNLGSAGSIEIAPNSIVNLNFADKSIAATLTAGKVKVYNAAGVAAKITTKDETVIGDINQSNSLAVDVQSGATKAFAETGAFNLGSGKQTTSQDDDNGGGGIFGGISAGQIAVPIAIFGGVVAAAVIYVVTKDDDGANFGNTASPVR